MKTHLFPNYFCCFIPIFFCFPYLFNSVPRSPTETLVVSYWNGASWSSLGNIVSTAGGDGDYPKRRTELTEKIMEILWEK